MLKMGDNFPCHSQKALTCVHSGTGNHAEANMGKDGQRDQELGDLGGGEALGKPSGQSDAASGQEVVGVHHGMH